MTWTIGSKLKASFGTVVALTLISGAATFVLLKSAESGLLATVDQDLPAAQLTTEFEREILNARIHYIYHVTIQKPGAVAAGDKRFEGAREVLAKISRHYQRIGGSTEKVAALERDFSEYESALRQILTAVNSGLRSGPEYDAIVANWARLGGRLVDGAGALNAAATADTQTAIGDSVAHMSQTVAIAGVLSLLATLAGVVLAFWMVRSIRGFLTESAAEIAAAISYMGAASAQVADASRRVAQMATEQSSSIAIASEASQQVAGGAEGNRRDSEEMATAADNGRRATDTGNRLLADMVAAMREIGESSSKVSKVIRVIDEIAFQTNILALNAAVEAARAGESGRGFAVVADEVRTLAQRSAQAARETAVLIEESVQRSDRGGRQVEQLSGALGELVGVSDSLGRLAVAVREGSRNQAEGIGQVSSAVAALEQTTQDNAATAEECASAATELAGQAEAMNSIASRLKDYVGAR